MKIFLKINAQSFLNKSSKKFYSKKVEYDFGKIFVLNKITRYIQ